ncbi:mannose-1-phosphate guanylyltransferase/mannose-6-phosphate isomerase, partial [Vibrio vulnificus]
MSKLIPVVMAGGTGSRLWPMSRESFPKQFLSIDDSGMSLLQQTLQRLSGLAGIE